MYIFGFLCIEAEQIIFGISTGALNYLENAKKQAKSIVIIFGSVPHSGFGFGLGLVLVLVLVYGLRVLLIIVLRVLLISFYILYL